MSPKSTRHPLRCPARPPTRRAQASFVSANPPGSQLPPARRSGATGVTVRSHRGERLLTRAWAAEFSANVLTPEKEDVSSRRQTSAEGCRPVEGSGFQEAERREEGRRLRGPTYPLHLSQALRVGPHHFPSWTLSPSGPKWSLFSLWTCVWSQGRRMLSATPSFP